MINQLELLIKDQELIYSQEILHLIEEFIISFSITPETFINNLESYMINNKQKILTEQILRDIEKKIKDQQQNTEKLKAISTLSSNIKKQSLFQKNSLSIFDSHPPTESDKAFIRQDEQTQPILSCNDYLSSQFKYRNPYSNSIKIEIEHPSENFKTFLQSKLNVLNIFCRAERKLQVKQETLDFHALYNLYISKSFLKGSLENKRNAINYRLTCLQEQFLDYIQSSINPQIEFVDLSIPTQTSSYAFGRILCDSEGKINEKSIIFDREDLANKVQCCCQQVLQISLDIQKIDKYVLFPNQHVIVEGVHGENNQEFLCQTMIQKSYQFEISDEEQKFIQLKTKQMNINNSLLIEVAAGPFTTNDSLNYTPLQSFLVKLKDLKPEIIILFGPFVDKKHLKIKEGIIQFNEEYLTYQELFEEILISICQIIQNFGFDNTEIIIVPSPEDKAAILASLPQPRFETRQPLPPVRFFKITTIELFQNMHLVTNPAQLLINEDIQFHLLNSTMMKDLLTSAIYKFPDQFQNRITACLNELLQQRSLCPIYPLENSMNLEYWQEFVLEDNPKIVILPSIISEFATVKIIVVNETIFINPGAICKANTPGTYAEIAIYYGTQIPFQNRTRVDIKKM